MDELVQAAINNWAPRFTSQGVDYNDFAQTTARITRWDDWCREWCTTGDMHAGLAGEAENQGRRVSAGEAYIAAALCYHFGKFLFQDHHAEYMDVGRRSIDAFAKGLRLLDPTGERVEIPFEGTALAGTLRRPDGVSRPAVALLLPGLDSTKEEFFTWEEVFLKRGLATLSLEGPGQGECGYHLPIRLEYETAVSTAIDWLEKRGDLDAQRVGIAGVSLGGLYGLRSAAFEPRVKAVVANCGPWNLGECWDSMNPLSRNAFAYHSASNGLEEARQRAGKITLEGAAQKIIQPILIIQGRRDRLIPWEQAYKIADAVGSNTQVVMFENGNHVCNNIPFLYRPLTADWLWEQLG